MTAICFCGSPVLGQARSEDPRTTSRTHVGPFYLTPSLILKEAGIDTNVFNQDVDHQKDFTLTLTPSLIASVPIARRGLIKLAGGGDFVYYQRYASERSINPELSARGELYTSRAAFFVEPSYLKTRQRPNYEIDVRSRRVEEGTAGGADVRLRPKLVLVLAVRQMRTVFDGDEFFLGTHLSETLNRNSWTYETSGRWALTPLTTFVVKGEKIQDRFLISSIRNSDSTRVTAGFELNRRALISGSGFIGLRKLQPLDARVAKFNGVVASSNLSYSFLGTTTISFTAARDTDYSFEPTQPYYVSGSYGLSLRRQLVGKLDAITGFSRSRNTYRDIAQGTLSPGGSEQRKDITDSYEGNVGYRLGPGRLGVGVTYWMRSSNTNAFRNYSGLRIGSTFNYSH